MTRSLAEELTTEAIQQPSITAMQPQSNAESRKLVKAIQEAALDAKGIDILAIDVSKNFGLADHFIVISGRSDRHVQGLANKILEKLDHLGIDPYSMQGMEEGHWVVLDLIDVVVHIFYQPLRERYDLESLWLDPDAVAGRAMTAKNAELVPA